MPHLLEQASTMTWFQTVHYIGAPLAFAFLTWRRIGSDNIGLRAVVCYFFWECLPALWLVTQLIVGAFWLWDRTHGNTPREVIVTMGSNEPLVNPQVIRYVCGHSAVIPNDMNPWEAPPCALCYPAGATNGHAELAIAQAPPSWRLHLYHGTTGILTLVGMGLLFGAWLAVLLSTILLVTQARSIPLQETVDPLVFLALAWVYIVLGECLTPMIHTRGHWENIYGKREETTATTGDPDGGGHSEHGDDASGRAE